MSQTYHKSCAVVNCLNTSKENPDMIFIHVPTHRHLDIRNQWLKLARIDDKGYSPKSDLYFCENHFDEPNEDESDQKFNIECYYLNDIKYEVDSTTAENSLHTEIKIEEDDNQCVIDTKVSNQSVINPNGFLDYVRLTENIVDTVAFLQQKGLIDRSKLCCRCKKEMKLVIYGNTVKWRCLRWIEHPRKKPEKCYYTVTIRKGSWFESTTLTLRDVVLLTYMIVQKFGETEDIARELDLSTSTVTRWIDLTRKIFLQWHLGNEKPIGGPGKIVEIGELKFETTEDNTTKTQWLIGGIERTSGQLFMARIESQDKSTILDVIKKWVCPGSTVISGYLKSYFNVKSAEYKYLTVDHQIKFKKPVKGTGMESLYASWGAIKNSMLRGKKDTQFELYLAEYIFYKHCRIIKRRPIDVFWDILKHVQFTELNEETNGEKEQEQEEEQDNFE